MKNRKDYSEKLKILEKTKTLVVKYGWGSNIIKKLEQLKVNSEDLTLLFPNGKQSLINFSYEVLNSKVKSKINNNIINFGIGKRIKKILILRLEVMEKDKLFFKKTFFHLLLPQNSNIMKKNLYKSVDEIWNMAGDNSTDFSFYTKRITLAAIYINALVIFFNKNINKAETNLDINLKRISKIPEIKQKFSFLKNNLPIFLKEMFN